VNRNSFKRLVVLAAVVAAAPAIADTLYVDKPLGAQTLHLPQLDGFAAACEQSPALTERVGTLTPTSSRFMTCFVEQGKWAAAPTGTAADYYPLVAVTVLDADPSDPFTSADFERLRTLTRERLGPQQELNGFFDVSGEDRSFSYVVSRTSEKRCELEAVSTILYEGNLLNLMVVSDCNGSPPTQRIRDTTSRWLRAFSAANRRAS
jgi:hypothetical protein